MIRALFGVGRPLPGSVNIGGVEVPISWRRNPKARRYILRVKRPACLVATIPRGGSQRDALAFIERSTPWIQQQLAKPTSVASEWRNGTEVWFRGEKFRIQVLGDMACIAAETIPVHGDLKVSVWRHFQKIACEELAPRTWELAAQTGMEISRVTIRSQRSRWGSCSALRTISLNWRLIQTPPFVVDYIILHELMHLRQMNHSRRFWDEVESVCPAWRDAEKWLRQHGREIMPG